ncbi:Translation initiation factor eIF-2B subunit alpha [Tetrabaena socialis]|uniref:Translation initiation factor eIF-2B subunit alpha n=1 Tax=Tetrabaena socialis TaxID=47790 RepID=A0A2J7ZR45_9CHLO|nr:Translation initiation factor eIF-2B subunit alpha [Tetrabaena socialis]|eukprot:PNH02744.1 Translation initiation factor eIF-2B subunit alpha [Tetrabaena socialis]
MNRKTQGAWQGAKGEDGAQVINPSRDYTPPQWISLLVTDLGVLTPAAVSDELIQLYL